MNSIQNLNVPELIYATRLVKSSRFGLGMAWTLSTIFGVILPLFVDSKIDWWFVLFAFFTFGVGSMLLFVFLIWWPFRYVSADHKAGQKFVEKTTIERLQKVGFFEMQADSALGIMAGAIYYLWLPDETRSPPHRRFRIGLTTYRQLMVSGSDPIEIAYLPKSGMILSIDTAGYRYAAWEPSDKRHQYKSVCG